MSCAEQNDASAPQCVRIHLQVSQPCQPKETLLWRNSRADLAPCKCLAAGRVDDPSADFCPLQMAPDLPLR